MILAYQKYLGKFTKVLGIEKTPPPPWEKFLSFLDVVPKASRSKGPRHSSPKTSNYISLSMLSMIL